MPKILSLSKERWLVFLGAAMVFCLDALSKAYIVSTLQSGESYVLIPGVFQLTRLQNTGAAFSMFYQHPEVLTAVAGGLLVVFTGYMLTKKDLSALETWGFIFVLGGAMGNLVDRIRVGAVTDFLDFNLINYPVFNLADSFILIGVIFLLIEYVKQHQTSRS